MYTIENNFHKNNSTLDYKRLAYSVKTETKTIQSSKTHPQNKGLELIQCNKETRPKEMQGGIYM
jgi:hypothetical protein